MKGNGSREADQGNHEGASTYLVSGICAGEVALSQLFFSTANLVLSDDSQVIVDIHLLRRPSVVIQVVFTKPLKLVLQISKAQDGIFQADSKHAMGWSLHLRA